MPANLTPDYKRAEQRYREARTPVEKIEALEEMLRVIPKHKGTDHLQADIKRKLAKLREAASQKKGKGGVDVFHVDKHGAGQFAFVGAPNSGKSALVGRLTGAQTHVAPFPFATGLPAPGMMPFEDVQIQLIDLPPVTPDGFVPGMLGALRFADGLIVCLDLAADDLLEQSDVCFRSLAERGIVMAPNAPPEGGEAKPILVAGTKADLPAARGNLEALRELRPDLRDLLLVSAETGEGLAELARRCFVLLDIVRIYTKEPGEQPDMQAPFTLRRGSTVLDLANEVHRELAKGLKSARVWGSARFDGQTVVRDHVLEDGDIVELHM
jgi:ribosome-interacting GTPase 1